MYAHYCCHNQNMNWLMGFGLLFNTIGNMFSGNRSSYYPPLFGMPLFSYPQYQYYPPTQQYPYQTYETDFLVGNTLAGINPDIQSYTNVDVGNSIFNSIPVQSNQNQDYNLVGNSLISIANSSYTTNSQNPFASTEQTPVIPNQAANSVQPVTPSPSNSVQPGISSPSNSNTTGVNHTPQIGNNNQIIRNGDRVKISKDIENRIKQMAIKLNCDYKDLIGMIWAESRFNPKVWNGKTAVGLIQFTQICIDDLNMFYGLNLTKQKIANMSALEQLNLAEKSLLRSKQIAGYPSSYRLSAGELYAINLAPAYAKRKNYILRRGDKDGFYEANKGADVNKDGYITKSELDSFIRKGRQNVTTIA